MVIHSFSTRLPRSALHLLLLLGESVVADVAVAAVATGVAPVSYTHLTLPTTPYV